ncbi:hypothetical protein NGM10_13035 [Halorussus salilacus]|uniref:hypothetical protein n=1 Tax=Halorussus salilacus TaxID=2953750 RepID=UPI0020A14B53|nr:hypothetical protein [Halorussus salilacus]USZ67648.1 hypothetical protein NGM10_13035 [Halorussus salilacus]
MVEDRTTDGKRIAQLLSSEVDGREDSGLGALAVVDADPDVEGSADGELAYRIARRGTEDTEILAEVYVHDDRARIEFREGVDAAAEAAEEVDLRVRPKAVRPPRTLVFVEDGAEVKRATDVLVAVLRSGADAGSEPGDDSGSQSGDDIR